MTFVITAVIDTNPVRYNSAPAFSICLQKIGDKNTSVVVD